MSEWEQKRSRNSNKFVFFHYSYTQKYTMRIFYISCCDRLWINLLLYNNLCFRISSLCAISSMSSCCLPLHSLFILLRFLLARRKNKHTYKLTQLWPARIRCRKRFSVRHAQHQSKDNRIKRKIKIHWRFLKIFFVSCVLLLDIKCERLLKWIFMCVTFDCY